MSDDEGWVTASGLVPGDWVTLLRAGVKSRTYGCRRLVLARWDDARPSGAVTRPKTWVLWLAEREGLVAYLYAERAPSEHRTEFRVAVKAPGVVW